MSKLSINDLKVLKRIYDRCTPDACRALAGACNSHEEYYHLAIKASNNSFRRGAKIVEQVDVDKVA